MSTRSQAPDSTGETHAGQGWAREERTVQRPLQQHPEWEVGVGTNVERGWGHPTMLIIVTPRQAVPLLRMSRSGRGAEQPKVAWDTRCSVEGKSHFFQAKEGK